MGSRTAVASLVVGSALSLPSCGSVADLSVGGAVDLAALEAKCAAPAGHVDAFKNASELNARIAGRWYHCASSPTDNWSLPRGTGMIYRFEAPSSWALLDYGDAQQSLTPSTDPDRYGSLTFYAITGTVTAGEFDTIPIPLDDTTTRNGIVLYLQHASENDAWQFQPTFEQNPRRLHITEFNKGGITANFVPIDD